MRIIDNRHLKKFGMEKKMRNNRTCKKLIAIFICLTFMFSTTAFAMDVEENSQTEMEAENKEEVEAKTEAEQEAAADIPATEAEDTNNQTEAVEQEKTETESEESVEDIKPGVLEPMTLELDSQGRLEIPITMGSGKYEADRVYADLESSAIVFDGDFDPQDGKLKISAAHLYRNVKAGVYPLTLQWFGDGVGHFDTESIKVHIKNDISVPKEIEKTCVSNGRSDVVYKLADKGSGLAQIRDIKEVIIQTGNDFEHRTEDKSNFIYDSQTGELTIKSHWIKEGNLKAPPTEYFVWCVCETVSGGETVTGNSWKLFYDEQAETEAPPEQEVVLPEGKTEISSNEMTALVEQNKESDVIVRTSNGVTFTFLKGTMKLIDGKEVYDFGTDIITDLTESGISGISKEEFAFRINFNYSGELPGKARISIPLGKNSKWIGKRLFYARTESGNIVEQICDNVVDKEGVYTIEQEHCSDYVATTKKINATQTSKKQNPINKVNKTVPKTGDTSSVYLYLVLLLGAAGCTLLTVKSKKVR